MKSEWPREVLRMQTRALERGRRKNRAAWMILSLIVALARPASAGELTCYEPCKQLCEGEICSEKCDDGETCVEDKCFRLCGNAGEICVPGLICLGGACTAPQCASSSDCDGGRCRQCICEPIRECSADGGCDCTSNEDCAVGLACSMTGVCQAPVRPGPALEATCTIARGNGAASRGPLAALLLAAIALGARCLRRS